MPCIERFEPVRPGRAEAEADVLSGAAPDPGRAVQPRPGAEPGPAVAKAWSLSAGGGPGVGLSLRVALPVLSTAFILAGCGSGPSLEPSAAIGRSAAAVGSGGLPAPAPVRSWAEVRLQAARRLVAANPAGTYTGTPPDTLLAIPVLQVDLNADGSIRHVEALRLPGQAADTTQLAVDALYRAAPFGDVSKLPRPWRFVETFLFDDHRRFKPRTLD